MIAEPGGSSQINIISTAFMHLTLSHMIDRRGVVQRGLEATYNRPLSGFCVKCEHSAGRSVEFMAKKQFFSQISHGKTTLTQALDTITTQCRSSIVLLEGSDGQSSYRKSKREVQQRQQLLNHKQAKVNAGKCTVSPAHFKSIQLRKRIAQLKIIFLSQLVTLAAVEQLNGNNRAAQS